MSRLIIYSKWLFFNKITTESHFLVSGQRLLILKFSDYIFSLEHGMQFRYSQLHLVESLHLTLVKSLFKHTCKLWSSELGNGTHNDVSNIGLPRVQFLTGQSGFLAICLVKKIGINLTRSCQVFRPFLKLLIKSAVDCNSSFQSSH
jgi:hypothetical protein